MDNHPPSVCREHTLNLLRLHDVVVYGPIGDLGLYDLRKDGVVESHALPAQIPRHLIGRLSAKFGVPMGLFFERPGRGNGASGRPSTTQ